MSFREELRSLIDRAPELLVIGALANVPPTIVLWLHPDLRTVLFYGIWGGVLCGLAFMNNFQPQEELEEPTAEPKAWRCIVALEAAYVIGVWLVLRSGSA